MLVLREFFKKFTFHYELIITKFLLQFNSPDFTFTFHYELIITLFSGAKQSIVLIYISL